MIWRFARGRARRRSRDRLAFESYHSALDREERAATAYAGVMTCLRDPAETGLAHRLSRTGGVVAR